MAKSHVAVASPLSDLKEFTSEESLSCLKSMKNNTIFGYLSYMVILIKL